MQNNGGTKLKKTVLREEFEGKTYLSDNIPKEVKNA